MKINDQLLGVVNARFEDLMFEVGILGRLEDFQTKTELDSYFAQTFEKEQIKDIDGEVIEELTSDEEKLQEAFKRALNDIGVADRDELLAFLSNKLKQPVNDLDEVKEVVQVIKDDLTNVLQLDRVSDSLGKFGAKAATLKDVEKIKKNTLKRLFGSLGIEEKEVENE